LTGTRIPTVGARGQGRHHPSNSKWEKNERKRWSRTRIETGRNGKSLRNRVSTVVLAGGKGSRGWSKMEREKTNGKALDVASGSGHLTSKGWKKGGRARRGRRG